MILITAVLEVFMIGPSNAGARTLLAATLLCGVVLSGCGRGADNQAGAPKGQIVAHVGNDVITIQELDNEFRLDNIPPDKQKDPATFQRVMGDLVARKYLVRQALDSKLDREPGVLLDILRSRELVLANAAISRSVAAKVSAISKSDIDKYIASNSSKFANRKLISIEQITFPIEPSGQAVVDAMRDAKSLDEIDEKLTAMNVRHSRSMGAINSADLPENLFDQMQTKKPNDVFFLRSGPNGVFIDVKSEEARPLGGEAAVNFARQALRADLFKSESGMASVEAHLEAKYEGDYLKLMGPQGQDPSATQK
jgi:EpsD family peptidyl-prolyl cis-trans isomerase